jgi:hypothetical protein
LIAVVTFCFQFLRLFFHDKFLVNWQKNESQIFQQVEPFFSQVLFPQTCVTKSDGWTALIAPTFLTDLLLFAQPVYLLTKKSAHVLSFFLSFLSRRE